MKFECPECHAKYQIADEKIRGRTLKMDCRRCQYRITIKGTESEPEAPAPAARRRMPPPAGARRGGSHVGPMPRRSRASVASPAPKPPAAPAKASWHVAINDVPVGPIGREEMSKKVASGAVTADSLCWREGFAEWKPLGEVEELADLLQPKAQPKPKPQPKPQPSRPALPAARRPIPQRSLSGAGKPGAGKPGAGKPGVGKSSPAHPVQSRPSQPGPPSRPLSKPTPVSKPARSMPSPRAPLGAAASAKAKESRPSSGGAKVVPISGRSLSAAPVIQAPEPAIEEPEAKTEALPDAPLAAETAAEAAAEAQDARPSDIGLDFAEAVEADALDAPRKSKKKRSKKKKSSRKGAKKDAVQDFFGADATDLRDSLPSGAGPAPEPEKPEEEDEELAVAGFTSAPEAAALATAAPATSATAVPAKEEAKEEKKGGLPLGAWIAIVGAGAFGIALAVLVAPALVANNQGPAVAANTQGASTTTAEPQTPEAVPDPNPEVQAEEPATEGAEGAEGAEGEGETAEGEGETSSAPPPVTTIGGSGGSATHRSGTHHASAGSTSAGSATSSGGSTSSGSSSRQATNPDPRFDRFQDDTADEAPINTVAQTSSGRTQSNTGSGGGSSAPALTSSQISAVVRRERQGLQRCYETAMRQTGQARTVRMDIDITIGSGGGVVSVRARGQSLGSMSTCIERAVRRWRFPPSGDQSRTSFPIVFAGQD